MKINYTRITFLILTVATAVLIFVMSAQTATVSSSQSGKVIEGIAKVLVKDFESYDSVAKDLLINEYQNFIRKSAHFFIYAVLGFFSYGFVNTYKISMRRITFLFSWGFCIFYAATDEFHQLFISGRSGMLKDVVLDSVGAVTGILVFMLTLFIFKRLRGYFNGRKQK